MAEPAPALFDRYKGGLTGIELTHTWRGHGSVIFFEFCRLTPKRRRRDGSDGNPDGEFGVMIEWSWRVERGTSIVFGSWSDDELWEAGLRGLRGAIVTDLRVFGRLRELESGFSCGPGQKRMWKLSHVCRGARRFCRYPDASGREPSL